MKIKTTPEMTVLSVELKTNLESMVHDIGDLNKKVYQEAVKYGLHPTGPQYWIYKWDGNDTQADFMLKIALPVAQFGNAYSGTIFKLEKLVEFKCLAAEHYGEWINLKETYRQLMEKMNTDGLVPGQTCRELYINADFENGGNNITEVQFELN